MLSMSSETAFCSISSAYIEALCSIFLLHGSEITILMPSFFFITNTISYPEVKEDLMQLMTQ